jgi:hypothetical protein
VPTLRNILYLITPIYLIAMKYTLIPALIIGLTTIAAPAAAQFSSFSSGSDNCSGVCVKLDFGSANNDNSFNSGFGSSSTTGGNNLRWQLGLTWKPNPPEIAQVEAERTKQRLEDNRTLMVSLADAIAQNKTELARGLAILLAPRLGYSNPLILLAEMKQGSVNIGAAPANPPQPNTNLIPTIQNNQSTNNLPGTIELR